VWVTGEVLEGFDERPKEKRTLVRPRIDRRVILIWIFNKWDGGHGLDWSSLGKGQVAGCCECGNKPLVRTKCGNLLASWRTVRFSGRTLFFGGRFICCIYVFSKWRYVINMDLKLNCPFHFQFGGLGRVVGIATTYGLDGPGIESRWGEIFRTSPDWPWGPPSLLYSGYRVFPGGKVLPGREAEPSSPSSAEV